MFTDAGRLHEVLRDISIWLTGYVLKTTQCYELQILVSIAIFHLVRRLLTTIQVCLHRLGRQEGPVELLQWWHLETTLLLLRCCNPFKTVQNIQLEGTVSSVASVERSEVLRWEICNCGSELVCECASFVETWAEITFFDKHFLLIRNQFSSTFLAFLRARGLNIRVLLAPWKKTQNRRSYKV